MMGEKRKAVSFNLDNDRERAMFEYVSKTNFSQLVKKYLEYELQRIATEQVVNQQRVMQPSNTSTMATLRNDSQSYAASPNRLK
ncbi:MAG: hypothetical protein OWR52_02385 [Acidibacillus sp.]|nr:hypothetical protein [Acidibacillus sp.]